MHTTALAAVAVGMGEEVRDEAALRARAYGLLGALLAGPPDQGLLARLREIDPAAGDARSRLAPAWAALRLAAERADPGALDDEYHTLFIGMGRGELVPYGSWYLSGFMMDRPLAELRTDLAALGFERRQDVAEPEDHAAALLETMAMLAEDEACGLDEQRRFFQAHLAPWMKTFFTDLQQAEHARLYRAVGHLGEQFMEFEDQYLRMLV